MWVVVPKAACVLVLMFVQIQQHKAAQQPLQQDAAPQLSAPPAEGDSDMTPADDPDPTAAAAMEVQQEGAADMLDTAANARAPQQQAQGAQRASSMLSVSSGSLLSLGGSSFPPVNITAAEFDRLGMLLEAARISKVELAVLLEQSSGSGSSSGGAMAGSSRSLFDQQHTAAGAARGNVQQGGAATAGTSSSGSGGDWLAGRINTSSKLSSFMPGFFSGSSVSMEECSNWISSCWLHKMQQALVQQHKAAASACAGQQPPGVSPLLQQPAFGSSSAAGDAPGSSAKQPTGSNRSAGVASMLGDMGTAGGSNSGNVAAWLGMSSSPPNAAAQQLRALGSPAGLNAASAAAGGGLGTFVGGLNGVPVVTSVSREGPSPLAPGQGAGGASPGANAAGAAGSSPLGAAAAAAAGSPGAAAGDAAAAAASGSSGGAGLAGLLSGPSGLSSIKVSTTRGMVAVAGGSVDEHSICGVHRGTVVRGPADVAADCLTIQDCNEAHVYVLAPTK